MKSRAHHSTIQRSARRLLVRLSLTVWLALVLALLPGCTLPLPTGHALTPSYHPRNVFVWNSVLPANIRRVAFLPMACDPYQPQMADGKDVLEPIVATELAKIRRFEILRVDPAALQSRTGQAAWGCEQALPQDLFAWLSESCGCDAALFCRLTVFRGYAPLAVGWRMRLVDLRSGVTLWAGDEVFDASQPSVQAGARRYQLAGQTACGSRPDAWAIENSPRQFGEYAAAQLLGTLPGL